MRTHINLQERCNCTVVTVYGAPVRNESYAKDEENFYVWFTAFSNPEHFNRSQVEILFLPLRLIRST
jgi:hypothetical protein